MTREEIFALVEKELQHAVKKHGPTFSGRKEMMNALIDEVCEVAEAIGRNDIYGKHGMERELIQVIVVCFKALRGWSNED